MQRYKDSKIRVCGKDSIHYHEKKYKKAQMKKEGTPRRPTYITNCTIKSPGFWIPGTFPQKILMKLLIKSFIYVLCWSVCLSVFLFVCFYPINVKTAEPIGLKFCVGPQMTQGKFYGPSKWNKNSGEKK